MKKDRKDSNKNNKENIKKEKIEKTNEKKSVTMYELKSMLPKEGNFTMYKKDEFEEDDDPELLSIINDLIEEQEEELKEFNNSIKRECKNGKKFEKQKKEKNLENIVLYEKLEKDLKNIEYDNELIEKLIKLGDPYFAIQVLLGVEGYSKKDILKKEFLENIYEYLDDLKGE